MIESKSGLPCPLLSFLAVPVRSLALKVELLLGACELVAWASMSFVTCTCSSSQAHVFLRLKNVEARQLERNWAS